MSGIIGFASAWNVCAISFSVQVLRIKDSEFVATSRYMSHLY